MNVLIRLIVLFVLIIMTHTFVQEVRASEMQDTSFLLQQSKYLGEGQMEFVTFSSKVQADEPEEFVRTGFLVKRPKARGTVLMCHGFMCNKYDTGFLRGLFPTYNVMMFDFRAHGDHITDKQMCTFGKDEACDVIAAVEYLRARKDLGLEAKPLIGYGFSMGAVASIQAQAQRGNLFDAMILDCPFDCTQNIIKKCCEKLTVTLFGYTFSLPGRGLLERYAFNPMVQSVLKTLLKTVANLDATATNTFLYPLSPVESISKITVPVFLVHCVQDEKVTVDAAKSLFNNAGGYKRLWLTAGRRHFDSYFYNPEKYMYKVNKFIDDVITGAIEQKIVAKMHVDSIVTLS